MDVKGLSDVSDYVIVCSLDSARGVKTIAEEIQKILKELGEPPLGVEGFSEAKWVLIDSIDVIANIFYEPTREFYDLEGFWIDAPRVELTNGEGSKSLDDGLVEETA